MHQVALLRVFSIGPVGCTTGGMPVEEGSSKIIMQELKLSFAFEALVETIQKISYRLEIGFEIDCRKIDTGPELVTNLRIKNQEKIMT